MLSFPRAASRRDRARLLFVAPLLMALMLFVPQGPAIGGLAEDTKLDAGIAAERYALPITPPIDQGNSDLCWVFATLSMLETNYMVRHPGSKIALSRAALQVDSISDPFGGESTANRYVSRRAGLPSKRSRSFARTGSSIKAISTTSWIPTRFFHLSKASSQALRIPRTKRRRSAAS